MSYQEGIDTSSPLGSAIFTIIITRGIVEFIQEGKPFKEWSSELMIACFYWAFWLILICAALGFC